MQITEEQRQRAEANRLAALEKRKAYIINQQQQPPPPPPQNPWRLFKCRKLSPKPSSKAVKGFPYPGEEKCLNTLKSRLSNAMESRYTQINGGGRACVYNIRDYDVVLTCLKNCKGIEIEKIPFTTLNIIQRLSKSFDAGRWEPCRPEHFTDEKVDEFIRMLPRKLLDALLPFQLDGLRFGLRRGGRCLIADEMGLGKTLQAIAIAGCFINEGPILVVCPAILRFSWAEELERWMPFCLPSEIHLVFGHRNNPMHLTRCPKVVVISYTMLHHLRKTMLEQEWALMIVDESHHVRCSKNKSEANEIKAVLDVAEKVKRIVLLSGTPSLSRPFDIFHQINMLWPGLLGQNKYDFAKTYCAVRVVRTYEGKGFQDFSKGIRLEELNVLLRQTVMIRRLKEHVLKQLPPKRRQIIRLLLKRSDIISAKAACGGLVNHDASERNAAEVINSENIDGSDESGGCCRSKKLSYQELGIAKLSGFCEWLSIHPLISESDGVAKLDVNHSSQKMIIFAHHLKVLDGVQEFVHEKGVGFVRIDGNTLANDRQNAVLSFQSSNKVKVAIIGITAGGVGLDFSSAQNVVFLELPQSPSLMLQAEDRAHRRGQSNAVNIYIFCAKDTLDETCWQNLNKSLHRVSSIMDGKYDAVPEILVERISYFGKSDKGIRRSSEVQVKLPDSGSVWDSQPFKTDDEENVILIGSTFQTDDLNLGAAMVLDNLTDKDSVANKNLEGISEIEIRSSSRVSSSESSEGHEGNDHSEKENKLCVQTTETNDSELAQQNEADECWSNEVYSLRFEVSKYTGRIHLYSCILGKDSRPQPLYENFQPEELESLNLLAANDSKETDFKFLKGNPVSRHALLSFIKEWNALRPIERRKLRGKTLQLPLHVELCYLNESTNHKIGGLLKGGSKRRLTPLGEISHPLPSNAILKKVHLSSSYGQKEKQYTQGWTLMDEPLCKLCQMPCKGSNAKTPVYFEDLFCNLICCEEYRLRTSSRSLRQELFEIEHGVCTICQLDCHQLVRTIKPLSLERRREYIEEVAPNVASQKKLLDKLANDPSEGNAWHADHIVPVYRGGGECKLENMRTLCVACHSSVTAAQRAERCSTREQARKQLQVIMNDIKCMEETSTYDEGQGHPQMQEGDLVDDLLVKVPGSAYSRGQSTHPESEDMKKSS
uniref:DNA annealing helicase and endonuclease ZRANB3 n=1 Tax=Populus alba TaxID=43335 RepID=A0A4V6A7X8_POPAL|nr:DNA annealing helicase and endonuclease ZRANB3 [Populus alba]